MRHLVATPCAIGSFATGLDARAGSLDESRRGFAQAVCEHSRDAMALDAPQPLLRTVGALCVRTDDGGLCRAESMHETEAQPALARVEHLGVAAWVRGGLDERLHREGFVEVWPLRTTGASCRRRWRCRNGGR